MGEFWDMIHFVEEHTPGRYSEERMRELVENIKVCHDYYNRTQELRKATPCPLRSRDSRQVRGLRGFMEGLPETVETNKALYEETKEMVEKGEGAIPNERHRLIVNGVPPFWNMKFFDWMEEKFGAVVVVDLCNRFKPYQIEDAADPLETVARKALKYNIKAMTEPCPGYTEESGLIAKEAGCDSSIYFAHFGCKLGCGAAHLTADILREEADIPTLVMDIDAYDPRVIPEAKMKDVTEEYFATLEERKKSYALT
jgi:benzoyl-CoA reductase/2-hydroxyglutaryl-CoA dehydratase subunit BcrC/BadD/HgdB